jgi:hypothetical protein
VRFRRKGQRCKKGKNIRLRKERVTVKDEGEARRKRR